MEKGEALSEAPPEAKLLLTQTIHLLSPADSVPGAHCLLSSEGWGKGAGTGWLAGGYHRGIPGSEHCALSG